MNCPFDGTTLQVVNRSGIEIDWCPECRGVWLERGELDRLIDRLAPSAGPAPRVDDRPASPRRDDRDVARRWDDDDDDWGDRSGGWDDDRTSRRRKRSLLGEIFDF